MSKAGKNTVSSIDSRLESRLTTVQTIGMFDLILIILSLVKNFNRLMIWSSCWAFVLLALMFFLLGFQVWMYVNSVKDIKSRSAVKGHSVLISILGLTVLTLLTVFTLRFNLQEMVVDTTILITALFCYVYGLLLMRYITCGHLFDKYPANI